MAGDRPAVIGEELVERIQDDQIDVAKLPHVSPWPAPDGFTRRTVLPSDIIEQKARTGRRRECGSAPPGAVLDTAMASFLSMIVLPVAVGAVALVLLAGLVNMLRGGSPNRSQNLMRWRVLLQFVAIVITMLTVWVMGH